MKSGILLLFRPSVLFFALALVVFVTMMALNAGDSSAKLFNCSPDGLRCSGGQGGPGGGGGGNTSCTEELVRDSCTSSGGGSNFVGQGPAGGRINHGEDTTKDCVLAGNIPNTLDPPCPEETTS